MEDSFGVSVYEPEIDMNRRRLHRAPVGRIKRLFNTLHRFHAGRIALGKPRRSIDREMQEYSPLAER